MVARPAAPTQSLSPKRLGRLVFTIASLAPMIFGALGCSTEAMFRYPSGDATEYMEGLGTSKTGHLAPGDMRFRKDVCKDFDLHPEYHSLDENALTAFLQKQGFQTRAERARNDLVYIDVMNAGSDVPVRLRVAILKTPADAGRELHEAVLQHGPGSWGVHRANLAILAPIADTGDAVSFAMKTHLACWGVMTMAGRDDSFVVPGAYVEL